MMKKRIFRFSIGIIVLVGIMLLGMTLVESHKENQKKVEAEQRKAEDVEQQEQIQKNFEEMIAFAKEYTNDIEALSVASIEQAKDIERLQEFDYEKVCTEAGIGEVGALIKEKFHLDTSLIIQSIKWQNEVPEEYVQVQYNYRCEGIGSTKMYLVFFSDVSGEPHMGGKPYGECVQITEQLYAVWYIPLYT